MTYVKVLGIVAGIGLTVCSVLGQSTEVNALAKLNEATADGTPLFKYQSSQFALDSDTASAWKGEWMPPTAVMGPGVGGEPDKSKSLIGSFSGSAPQRTWTLFLADLSAGQDPNEKSLSITMVPEPRSWVLLWIAGGVFWFGRFRRRAQGQ